MSDAPVHGVIGARIETLFATLLAASCGCGSLATVILPESAPSLPRAAPSLTRVWTRVAVGAVMSVRPAERRSELPNAATVLIGQCSIDRAPKRLRAGTNRGRAIRLASTQFHCLRMSR